MSRSTVAVLVLMSTCGISVVFADPPPPPATSPAAVAPAAPATATTPAVDPAATQNSTATASAKPTQSAANANEAAQEKALRNAGWRPQMQHGQKLWCRREEVLGSRIDGKTVCGTADQIGFVGNRTEQDIMDAQKKLNTYPTTETTRFTTH